MKKRYMLVGLLVLMLVVAMMAVACGGDDETTTTAAPSTETTAAPSTETTAAPTETTAAPSTDTTTAGPATGAPIKVGFSNSITGFSAAPADSTGKGVDLMVEYVNANGGVNGRPLEVITLDDKSDVPAAIANLNKLIQEDKVAATIGPFAQFMQEPARGIAEQTGTPMVGMGPATLEQLAATPQYQMSVMLSAAPDTQADALDQGHQGQRLEEHHRYRRRARHPPGDARPAREEPVRPKASPSPSCPTPSASTRPTSSRSSTRSWRRTRRRSRMR